MLTMTSLIPYFATTPILDLSPFTAYSDIASGVSPLYYSLTHDDFHTYAVDNSDTYFCLDQGTGIALWWMLKRLYHEIICAATAQIPREPNLPLTIPAHYHVPDYLFRELDLAPPAILDIGYIDCMNSLYMYAPKEVIQAFWLDFQDVGKQAVQWIEVARYWSNILGQNSNWDWDTGLVSQLEFPGRRSITDGRDDGQYPYQFPSQNIVLTHKSATVTNEAKNTSTDVVLHPELSTFIQANLDFDVFAGISMVNSIKDPINVDDIPQLTSTNLSTFIYNIYDSRSAGD